MKVLKDLNKKLISFFGTPFSKNEHLVNLTYNALSIAIYGSNELDKNKLEHITWLTHYCIEKFYKKEEINIEDIKFFHKTTVPPNTKSVFIRDDEEIELKEIQRGEFRKINTFLNLKGHKIYFVDFRQIEDELKKSIDNYNQSSKSIRDISKILLEGFKIHPFMDGNGRTFRVLFDLLLLKNNYYPSLFNLTYKANEPFFRQIFTYYIYMDEAEGLEKFLDNLEKVYKVAYFSK